MSELLDIEKSAQRTIKSNAPYLHLFPKPDFQERVHKDGDVKKTLSLMRDIVIKFMDDTKKLAPLLKGKTLEDTCRNAWNFWYWHVQYKLDKGEELRRPARTIYEQIGDCDCFSIAVSQTLLNLGINNDFTIAKYKDQSGRVGKWQHVYVTVPNPQGGYFTLDCVAHRFNEEQKFADKFNYHMTTLHGLPIAVLTGFMQDQDEELLGILSGKDFEELDNLIGLGKVPSAQSELDSIYRHLVSTRDYIQKNPASVITTGGAGAHLQMLNYAIENWSTPNRDHALDMLEKEEERWNEHNGVNGLGNLDDDEFDGLGAKKGTKKFWGKVKETVKKVGAGVKQGVKKAGEAIKNVGKNIIKYNPLTLAVRGGFLLAMKINLLNMAGHLYPAYLSEAQARSKKISTEKWNKAKRAVTRIEKLFVDKLQGQKDKLRSAITSGRATKQFAGFGNLGEPATITSVVASAVPIIEAAKVLNSEGVSEAGEKLPENKTSLLEKVKEWWKKAFGKETSTAPVTISDEDKAPNESANEDGGETTNSGDRTASPEGEDSTWLKIKRFASDNPGTVAIGVLLTGAVITTAVVIHNKKKKERQGGEPRQLQQPATMSGTKRKKLDNPNILL